MGTDTQLFFRETHDSLHYCSTYSPSLHDEFFVVMQWYSVTLRLIPFESQKILQSSTVQYNYGYPSDAEEDDITWIDTLKTRLETLTIQNKLHFFNVFPFFNYDHARTELSQIAGYWVVNTDPFAVRGLNTAGLYTLFTQTVRSCHIQQQYTPVGGKYRIKAEMELNFTFLLLHWRGDKFETTWYPGNRTLVIATSVHLIALLFFKFQ